MLQVNPLVGGETVDAESDCRVPHESACKVVINANFENLLRQSTNLLFTVPTEVL